MSYLKAILFFISLSTREFSQNLSYHNLLGKWDNENSISGKTIYDFQDSTSLIMHITNPNQQEILLQWKYQLKFSNNNTYLTLTNEQIGSQFSYSTLIKLCSNDTLKIQQLDNSREILVVDGKNIKDNSINAAQEQWKEETKQLTTIFLRLKDD